MAEQQEKTKQCCRCKAVKPVSSFCRNWGQKDKYNPVCKKCQSDYWKNKYSYKPPVSPLSGKDGDVYETLNSILVSLSDIDDEITTSKGTKATLMQAIKDLLCEYGLEKMPKITLKNGSIRNKKGEISVEIIPPVEVK